MKRDPSLHALSSDHHHALVLARRAERAGAGPARPAAEAWQEVRALFLQELAPHFEIEERILLPALRAVGEGDLVERTLGEHAAIRDCIADADAGDVLEHLTRFAHLVTEHVRFEERVLFEVAQARLAPDVLAELARAYERS